MGESISTIQRSPRISMSYKFAALAISCRRWSCRRFRWASNLACHDQRHWKIAQSCRSPKDKVSARLCYHVSNSVVFVHRAGTLVKNIRPLSKLFSKAEPLPFEKEINNNLVYSCCLKHANEMLLGDPRQADQRTQSFPFPIVIHQSHSTLLLERSSAKLLVFTCTCTRALDRLRTRRRVGSTRRRGNHMHDHSRFQCDIKWRLSRLSLSLSLSLYYSQKSLTHDIGSASALPIIFDQLFLWIFLASFTQDARLLFLYPSAKK